MRVVGQRVRMRRTSLRRWHQASQDDGDRSSAAIPTRIPRTLTGNRQHVPLHPLNRVRHLMLYEGMFSERKSVP
jgi:hypothetical protein